MLSTGARAAQTPDHAGLGEMSSDRSRFARVALMNVM
jgi:hypothetical protein